MDQSILIHIGFHKTGTTWFQNRLFISGNAVFEPCSALSSGVSTLANHFYRDESGYQLSPFDLDGSRAARKIRSLVEDSERFQGKIPVISDERLSGHPHSGGFDRVSIAQRIKNAIPKARILIVFREQRDFLLSNYFQYLSIGGVKSLQDYLNQSYDGKIPNFAPHHLDYLALVKFYRELFGSDRVLALPYEMFMKDTDTFFKYFSDFLGSQVHPQEGDLEMKENVKRNHFVRYHFRFLNYFVHSTSVNNYSRLNTLPLRTMARGVYYLSGLLSPAFLNSRLQDRLWRKIDDFASNMYEEKNSQLSELIKIDLNDFGYRTA